MSNISVIGGSGFIGTSLAQIFLDSNHSVEILDKQESGKFPHLWKEVDIRDIDAIRRNLSKYTDVIVNLAAEHRDDVTPVSLYDEVNVGGSENICKVADELNIRKQIFTSSVAVYGFAPRGTDETGDLNYVNDYGRTKVLAEEKYSQWLADSTDKSLTIIRPTVVFGQGNRGNVYNLIKLIASKNFVMVGRGKNLKSLAYVENVAGFIAYSLSFGKGKHLFNYVDQPDFDMNQLVSIITVALGLNRKTRLRIPYPMGIIAGRGFDLVSAIIRKKLPISSVRIKKFCSDSQFRSANIEDTSFKPEYSLEKALHDTIKYEFDKPSVSN